MTDESARAWRALVERGLKGAPFESLTSKTRDGITLAPLYTAADAPAEQGVPWAPRAVRAVGAVHDSMPDLAAEKAAGATFVWVAGNVSGPIPDGLEVIAIRGPAEVRSLASGRCSAPIADVAPAVNVGWNASNFVDRLRTAERRGEDLEQFVARSTIAVAVGTDFFVEIATLRALRLVIGRVLVASGIQARPTLAAMGSGGTLAALDTPTNVLRQTLACAAALIGGADLVAVWPHRPDDNRAVRTARNVPLVLTLESHLGALADPASGSYFVESLTSQIAERAWSLLQELEAGRNGSDADGGGSPTRYSFESTRPIEAAMEARLRAIRTRRAPLVGVSKFPLPGDSVDVSFATSHPERDAAPFEALRGRSIGRSARVVVLPGCPEARVDFAREIAQLAATDVAITSDTNDASASFVIVCAPDADFGGGLGDAIRAIGANASSVIVAGKPGEHEAALRAAGATDFVFVGADVVDVLERALDRAEAAS